ncbi:MAG TPA: STAS/SEC14 domain-containing protein, partial [Actinophytocola sp.]|nr:STAS/SEC14 domain-containing protein [Actinophytocola sp.]
MAGHRPRVRLQEGYATQREEAADADQQCRRGPNIVTATYDGSVDAEELIAVRDRLRTVIRRHGRARLLVEYGEVDLGRIEPRAIWEDLKTTGVLADVDRIAVVADQGWLDTMASAAGAILPVQVCTFGRGRRDDAVAWRRGRPSRPTRRAEPGSRSGGSEGVC